MAATDGAAPSPVPMSFPYERFLDCIHCGLCVNFCPTFLETGMEADSPRGRIHLMRAVADGRIGFEEGVKEHIDLCLGCLACETACPSGVRYREIIEAGREMSRAASKPGVRQRLMERTLYDPDALEAAVQPIRWAGKLGMESAVRAVARKMPAGLGEMVSLLPHLPPAGLRHAIPEVIDAVGPVRRRVGFLTGCVMSVFFSPTNVATLQVLAQNGCEIYLPPHQGCCGALALHSGDLDEGKSLARRLIDRFLPAGGREPELEAIVVNAAGCGSAMKDYGHLFAEDPEYAERAAQFASLVRDASEFLDALPMEFPDPGTGSARRLLRVTYHDACHLIHGQKIRAAPRRLLEQMPGIELVELVESDVCCGSAGTYNLTQPQMAEKLMVRKTRHVAATEADVLVTANPGCSLQIERGLRETGSTMRVMHLMDLLATAYPTLAPGLPAFDGAGAGGSEPMELRR